MRILVLGGDGYLGWPTAMYLSARGHEVAVLDNGVRRHYDARALETPWQRRYVRHFRPPGAPGG